MTTGLVYSNITLGLLEQVVVMMGDEHIITVRCPGNWTVIADFITSYSPAYFENRPWIIFTLLSLAVLGISCNCAVILFMLLRENVGRSALSLLVFQLTVADCGVCLFCLLADGIWNVTMEWLGSTGLCRFIKFMQMFSLYASTMILTGMTVERCLTVSFPFSMSRPQTSMQRARVISLIAWIIAGVCSIPQALIFHVERAPICADFFQCVTFGAYTEKWQEVAYTMSTLCIMFIIPLIIIISCYLTIFAKISEESKIALGRRRIDRIGGMRRRVQSLTEPGFGRRVYRQTRSFSLWMTFVIALAYLSCWFPYYLSMLAYLFQFEVSNSWMTGILFFGMTSTLLNPVIYGVFRVGASRANLSRSSFIRRSTMRKPGSLKNHTAIIHTASTEV